MGQYYVLANLDRKEATPDAIMSSVKLAEQAGSYGPTAGILRLLETTWANNRLALVGDYAGTGDSPTFDTAYAEDGGCTESAYGDFTNPGRFTGITNAVEDMMEKYLHRRGVEHDETSTRRFWVVNHDARTYLDPMGLGGPATLAEHYSPDLKSFEWTGSVGSAVLVALAVGNGKGGGDMGTEGASPEAEAFVGSWAGQRLGIVFEEPGEGFVDVSGLAREVFTADGYVRFEEVGAGELKRVCSY